MRQKIVKQFRKQAEEMVKPLVKRMNYNKTKTEEVIKYVTKKLQVRYQDEKASNTPVRILSLKETKRKESKRRENVRDKRRRIEQERSRQGTNTAPADTGLRYRDVRPIE